MTVIVLLYLLLHVIPKAAPFILLPTSLEASLGYLASAAYIDNISSFFGNKSPHPTIRIAGWNRSLHPVTNRHGKALSANGWTAVKIA